MAVDSLQKRQTLPDKPTSQRASSSEASPSLLPSLPRPTIKHPTPVPPSCASSSADWIEPVSQAGLTRSPSSDRPISLLRSDFFNAPPSTPPGAVASKRQPLFLATAVCL